MKKALTNLIVIVYVILAIAVTICLLTYNQYKISEIAGKSLIIISEEDTTLPYNEGDLIIVGKGNKEKAGHGDFLFFYENKGVKIAKIEKRNDYGQAGMNYNISGNYQVMMEDVIGTSQDEKVIPNAGKVLYFLESKWGFLFLIVVPSLLAFLREIYELILEISGKSRR